MAAIINAGTSGPGGIQIGGDASGVLQLQAAGNTYVTITGGSTSNTVSIPGGVGGTAAFSASLSAHQTISNGVATKVQFNTVEYDLTGAYDPTTNYRYTPKTAGYYLVSSTLTWDSASGNPPYLSQSYLYKNGSLFKSAIYYLYTSGGTPWLVSSLPITTVVYMNGTTDYLEMYGISYLASTGSPRIDANNTGSAPASWFQATLIRSA